MEGKASSERPYSKKMIVIYLEKKFHAHIIETEMSKKKVMEVFKATTSLSSSRKPFSEDPHQYLYQKSI